jgi:hypothetical protein
VKTMIAYPEIPRFEHRRANAGYSCLRPEPNVREVYRDLTSQSRSRCYFTALARKSARIPAWQETRRP